MNDLHWYGLAGLLLALVVSHWATHLAKKTPLARADQTY
jgi:hypothetical protein